MANKINIFFIVSIFVQLSCLKKDKKENKFDFESISNFKINLDSILITKGEGNVNLYQYYFTQNGDSISSYVHNIFLPVNGEKLINPFYGDISEFNELRYLFCEILDSTGLHRKDYKYMEYNCNDTAYNSFYLGCYTSNQKNLSFEITKYIGSSYEEYKNSDFLKMAIVELVDEKYDTIHLEFPLKNVKIKTHDYIEPFKTIK